jgi:hypothetical protein
MLSADWAVHSCQPGLEAFIILVFLGYLLSLGLRITTPEFGYELNGESLVKGIWVQSIQHIPCEP